MNKDSKKFIFSMLLIATVSLFPISVYANSSWRWISETRPYDILPIIIVITLAVEVAGIYYIAKAKDLKELFFVVFIANILSFAAPYLFRAVFPSAIYTFEQFLEHTPFYTVGIVYLVMTLLVEVPFVFFKTKTKVTRSARKLLCSIIGVNIVTTVIVAIIERLICYGVW